jgi:hypothetical protein
MSQPPAVPNTQDLANFVRNYVHYDNLATGLYRQTVNARKVRDEFEGKILTNLRTHNMENAIIQIAGGRLVVHEERHNQPITLGRMEELLRSYYLSHNLPDDTQNIIKYMKKQRGYEVVKRLKKQAGPAPPPLPPVPPSQGPASLQGPTTFQGPASLQG